MRIDMNYKYMEKSEYLDLVLEKNFKKILRHIKLFKEPESVHTSISLEKNPHREEYFCRVHMYVPNSKVLSAQEKGLKCEVAINKTFMAVLKQLDKLKHRVEKYLRKKN